MKPIEVTAHHPWWTGDRIRLIAPGGNTMTAPAGMLAPLSTWMQNGWRTDDLHAPSLLEGQSPTLVLGVRPIPVERQSPTLHVTITDG